VVVHVARLKLGGQREVLGARPLRNPLGPVCLGNPDDGGKQRGNFEGKRGTLSKIALPGDFPNHCSPGGV
jgi:hypothetical protein